MSVEFTTASFQRSHGKQPKGRGSWAFQEATARTAFESELTGEVVFVQGTLTAAKAVAAQLLTGAQLVAVLS